MDVTVITLFPELFESFTGVSLIRRAIENDHLSLSCSNPRTFSPPPHHHVDDTPYGGGPGMVMKPEPLVAAIEAAKEKLPHAKVIAPTPAGKPFTQHTAARLANEEQLIFLCGRYEGIDERVLSEFVDEEISLGDYVLMGGEIPTMAILESVTRLLPGVLGNEESTFEESFSTAPLLEAPQYTKPAEFRGMSVPEVLRSGDHQKIKEWRKSESLKRTKERRPDLQSENQS